VGRFVARRISTHSGVSFGNPVSVPRSFPVAAPGSPRTFDVTPDGRIVSVTTVMPQAGDQQAASAPASRTPTSADTLALGQAGRMRFASARQIAVVLNWFEELKQKVPARR